MRASVVVKTDPVTDHSAGMLQSLKAVTMNTLLFQSPDHSFHQTVLLGRVWRDEFLLQAVAPDQRSITATCWLRAWSPVSGSTAWQTGVLPGCSRNHYPSAANGQAIQFRKKHPEGCFFIRCVYLSATGELPVVAGRRGRVCLGNSPVSELRKVTISATWASVSVVLSWVRAMTRTASSSVGTDPLWK